jgi:hypothetical protein
MKTERFQGWKTAGIGCLAVLLATPIASGAQDVRAQEISQCLAGEISTWADGVDRPVQERKLAFVYSHLNAPAWFSRTTVMASLQAAASGWSTCGIEAEIRDADVPTPSSSKPIAVDWSVTASRGNFGLADLGTRSLALGPQAFEMLRARNPTHDAISTLQMVISHEMGHFFGIMAHSRRCVDVTSYYRNGQGETCTIRGGGALIPGVEYRATLPTACDIARCRQINFPKQP